ncbi:MAG: DUF4012 domain-containing protein, partial [Chloroflexi bacterium]|nr:DUF4012 domain-containing protein [Chloroflexota bacterium]
MESQQERAAVGADLTGGGRPRRRSARTCPSCGRSGLIRYERPPLLRWLRYLGVEVRTYWCPLCWQKAMIRRGQADVAQPAALARRASGRRRLPSFAIPVAVLLLVAALASFQLLSARRHLIRGVQEVRSAREALTLSALWHDAAARGRTRATLLRALGEFSAAQADLRPWAPLIGRLGSVPVVGSQLAAAAPAADAALYTTRATVGLLDGLSPLWPALAAHRPGGVSLARVAPALQAGHAGFLRARSDADRAAVALRRLPGRSGNATLDAAAAELRRELPTLRGTATWLAAAPTVLGVDRPSHYLVLLQNPAELRATGGFIGAADYVTLQRGSLHSTFSTSALPHEIASVPTPLPEALYTPEGPWIFRDSNWSPDFPLSARLARWFYGEDTGRWADGVIGVVDTAVVPILGATGPVYVPSYHAWVDAANVDALAERYVHGHLYSGPAGSFPKEFLADVMAALLRRIQSLPADRFPALGSALSAEVRRRDIMLYDPRPAVRSAIAGARADGRLAPEPGDFLFVVDDNRSYSKLNPYVHEQATYRVVIRPDLRLDSTLTIRYYVAPSPPDLDGVGPGYGLFGNKHDYQNFLRVYVPAGARLLGMSGLAPWAPAPAYGLTQFAGRLLVRAGQTRTVTIRYRIPANALGAEKFRRYLLTVRRLPGGNLRSITLAIRA